MIGLGGMIHHSVSFATSIPSHDFVCTSPHHSTLARSVELVIVVGFQIILSEFRTCRCAFFFHKRTQETLKWYYQSKQIQASALGGIVSCMTSLGFRHSAEVLKRFSFTFAKLYFFVSCIDRWSIVYVCVYVRARARPIKLSFISWFERVCTCRRICLYMSLCVSVRAGQIQSPTLHSSTRDLSVSGRNVYHSRWWKVYFHLWYVAQGSVIYFGSLDTVLYDVIWGWIFLCSNRILSVYSSLHAMSQFSSADFGSAENLTD